MQVNLAVTPAPKIVVVDDDEAIVNMLAQIIRNFGFDVLAYSDPLQALKTIETHNDVAVLVCDFEMPDMDGAKLAAAAKSHNPRVTVFMFSGAFPPAMQQTFWDAWFLKGSHMMDMMKRLREVMRPPGIAGNLRVDICNLPKYIA